MKAEILGICLSLTIDFPPNIGPGKTKSYFIVIQVLNFSYWTLRILLHASPRKKINIRERIPSRWSRVQE